MANPLTPPEIASLDSFFQNCLANPEAMSHEELVVSIRQHHGLCVRAISQLQGSPRGPLAPPDQVTEDDLRFMESWMKARNLVIGGLQLLQLADPDNAASIQHEVECTETAFKLLPGIITEARSNLR